MTRTLISIGGWCGPALSLGKLGLRATAFPFDFSRVTLDGVIHFTRNGFNEGFFPPGPRPFKPECVGMWVLFRGQHTAFAHFDLNNPEITDGFNRKFQRWNAALRGDLGPVTFLRTVTARHPVEELRLVADFNAAVRQRSPRLDFRVAVAVHDQGLEATTLMEPMDENTSLWSIEYDATVADRTLFDRTQAGYAAVVGHCLDETAWPLRAGDAVADVRFGEQRRAELSLERPVNLDWRSFPWRSHSNLALIDGVASVGGTCQGIGSTRVVTAEGHMRCPHCGSEDWHKAGRPARTDRPFTEEEDELLLVHMYKIVMGGDKVEAVEQLAHEMGRGAFEVICRLQFLTQASTKITEGLGVDVN
jgi:hypothetical protein